MNTCLDLYVFKLRINILTLKNNYHLKVTNLGIFYYSSYLLNNHRNKKRSAKSLVYGNQRNEDKKIVKKVFLQWRLAMDDDLWLLTFCC